MPQPTSVEDLVTRLNTRIDLGTLTIDNTDKFKQWLGQVAKHQLDSTLDFELDTSRIVTGKQILY